MTDGLTDGPAEGDLQIWYIPQAGACPAYTVDVRSLDEACVVLDAVIGLSIFEFENRVKGDYSDAAGVHRYEADGEGGFDWFEVDEDEFERAGLEKP